MGANSLTVKSDSQFVTGRVTKLAKVALLFQLIVSSCSKCNFTINHILIVIKGITFISRLSVQ